MKKEAEVLKACRSCLRTLPVATGFYRQARNSDGYFSDCKDCTKALNTAWNKANRSKRLIYQARYRAKQKALGAQAQGVQ